MELLEAKISAMIGLGLGSLLVGLLPALFSRYGRQQWPLLLSLLLCFGAGVLLSTSLIHMLPEIRESMPKYDQYVELIYCIGFFLLYFIDEIVHLFYGNIHEHNTNITYVEPSSSQPVMRRHSMNGHHTYGATESQPLLFPDYKQRQRPYNPMYAVPCESNLLDQEALPSQLCHVGHQEPCSKTPIGTIGLLVALSIHAILEGLAVGVEKSTSKVLLMLGAIASHKLVVGFCLGAELSSGRATVCQHFVSIIIFSFGSVAGIAIGIGVTEIPTRLTKIVLPVLQGLAGGTLLYITVSEVLPRERARWHKQHDRRCAGVLQFIAVGVGFAVMTGITKYLDT